MLSPINANRAITNSPETKRLVLRSMAELDALPSAERLSLHLNWEKMAERVTRTKYTQRRRIQFTTTMPEV